MPDVQQIIRDTAIAEGIDPELAIAVARQESGFNVYAVGDGGDSHGLFQENIHGRGAGRAPDYDPVRQTQRFAADVRRLLSTGFTGTYGEIGAAAQRPFDPVGYARSIDAATGGGKAGLMAPIPRPADEDRAPEPSISDIQRRTLQAELDLMLKALAGEDDPLKKALQQAQIDQIRAEIANIGVGTAVSAATSAAGLAEQRRQFDIRAAMDAARQAADEAQNAGLLALQQGNAAEAKRQFDIAQSETVRWHDLQAQDMQQTQQLAAAKYGTDVYNKLTELASNPRNFMEQFFRLRGQPAPATAGNYGNSPYGGLGIQPLEQFLPKFLQQVGLGARPTMSAAPAGVTGAGAVGAMPTGAIRTGPDMAIINEQIAAAQAAGQPLTMGQKMYQSQAAGQTAAPVAAAAIPVASPNMAETALINGVPTWEGGAYAGQPVASTPANAGDLTPYLKPRRQFAKGGELRMTAPHAILNLITGEVAAIAGEEPGRGPQGFVPETATFDGEAIINPFEENISGPPSYDVPMLPASPTEPGMYAPPYVPYVPPAPTYNAPTPPPLPPPVSMPAAPVAPIYTPEFIAATNAPPPGMHWEGGRLVQNQIVQQPAPAPAPAQVTPIIRTPAPMPTYAPPPAPIPPPVAPAPPPVPAPAPVKFTDPATLMRTPSGLGRNPQFLPEELAAIDPIAAEMMRSGTFPPFLQRIFAQQGGLAGLGTNVPQQTNLPPGVPLISKLAYLQMIPSERAAFESYISAHGLTIEDYLNLVEAASPQGGTSTGTAFPRFLGQ
jgi:hypothetical protein